MLLATAYSVGFLLGLALALRPFLLLGALIFRPALLGVVGLAGAGALLSMPGDVSSLGPELTAGLGAVGLGVLAGLLLRSLLRGGV